MTFTQDTPRPAVRVRVPAKVNLALCVGGLGDDGFHPLVTVFEAVSLTDDVCLWPADEVSIRVSGADADQVPTGPENLAAQAFALMAERYALPTPGVHLQIVKHIPVAGGMAGGSADAAGTLLAINAWAGLDLSSATLQELAAELGSDVPFALVGGVALGTGRGDRLVPAMHRGQHHWVLAEVPGGLSTPEVYRRFDEIVPGGASLDVPTDLLDAVAGGDVAALAGCLRNDLAQASLDLRPDLADVLAAGTDAGALAGLVSGSGPTCAFLCADESNAIDVHTRLAAEGAISRVHRVHGPVPGARVITSR